MKIVLLYCHPSLNQEVYGPAARRFADSYMSFPPGAADHEIVVGINGGSGHGPYQKSLFDPLPVSYVEHSNWGKDIGLYQMASEQLPCDLLVCLGSFVHFHTYGWLDRIAQAFIENGPTLYGAYGFAYPRPHIRTTAFWIPPELMNAFPRVIGDNDRYGFEHGPESITLWSQRMGFEPIMVTQTEVLTMPEWRHVGHNESLFLDQFDDRHGPK